MTYPSPVPELIDFIKLLFLDLRKIVMLDCWSVGGFYGKIVTNVVVMPLLACAICMLIYLVEKRSLVAVIAAGGADRSAMKALRVKLKHNFFLAIFLVCELLSLCSQPSCYRGRLRSPTLTDGCTPLSRPNDYDDIIPRDAVRQLRRVSVSRG